LPSDHFGDESGAAVFWVETISDAVLPAAGEKHGNVASVRLRLEIVAWPAEGQVGFRIF